MAATIARITFQQVRQSVSELKTKYTIYQEKVHTLLQQGKPIRAEELEEKKALLQQIEKCQTAFARLRKTIQLRNEHLDMFTAVANDIEVTLPMKMQDLEQAIEEGPDWWKKEALSSLAKGAAVFAFIYGIISFEKYLRSHL